MVLRNVRAYNRMALFSFTVLGEQREPLMDFGIGVQAN